MLETLPIRPSSMCSLARRIGGGVDVVVPRHEQALGFRGRGAQPFEIADGVAERLLAHHVLARLEAGHGGVDVGLGRRQHADRVHRRVGQ